MSEPGPPGDAAAAAHTGEAAGALPPLHRGIADAGMLAALLADLAAHAEVLEVRLKHGARRVVEEGVVDLAVARAALAAGAVAGVQVTYRWAHKLWIDTLLTHGAPPGGARVIRMEVQAPPPSLAPP